MILLLHDCNAVCNDSHSETLAQEEQVRNRLRRTREREFLNCTCIEHVEPGHDLPVHVERVSLLFDHDVQKLVERHKSDQECDSHTVCVRCSQEGSAPWA